MAFIIERQRTVKHKALKQSKRFPQGREAYEETVHEYLSSLQNLMLRGAYYNDEEPDGWSRDLDNGTYIFTDYEVARDWLGAIRINGETDDGVRIVEVDYEFHIIPDLGEGK